MTSSGSTGCRIHLAVGRGGDSAGASLIGFASSGALLPIWKKWWASVTQWDNLANTRLLRVDLDPDLVDSPRQPEVTIVLDPTSGYAAADTSNPGTDLVAILHTFSGRDCYALAIVDGRTGTILNEGTAWPAWIVSWTAGKVLSRDFSKGCNQRDVIAIIDPVTGERKALITGSDADGR